MSLPDQLLDLAFQYASQKFAEILDKLRSGKPITDSEANFILLFMVLNQTKVGHEALSKRIELNGIGLREAEERLSKRIDRLENEMKAMEERLNKRMDEVKEDLNKRIEDVRNELNGKIDRSWEEMKLMEERLNKRMDDIEQSIDELKAGMAGLNSQMKLVVEVMNKVIELIARK